MKYTEEEMNEKPVFIIDEKPEVIPGQAEGETPIIIIENDDEDSNNDSNTVKTHRRLPWVIATAIITALLCIIAVGGYWYYRRHVLTGVPVSFNSEQNIAKLEKKAKKVKPEVIMSTDSILGVTFNLYEIRGLKAEISFDQPDSTDRNVYLYSRSADFTSYDPKTNEFIGSLVQNGKELQSDVSRLGYCAMANNNIVIGVARDDKVKDYCIEKGGSFFRQFILVSNGQLPIQFHLHGKVERRALGRKGETLYYIESCDKEGMTEFADALREYGFTDAIYITGGDDYSYYRDRRGRHHSIGNVMNRNKELDGKGIIPWLVFKKR